MLKSGRLAVLASAVMLPSAIGHAQAAPGPLSFECDTKEGHYSETVFTLTPEQKGVRGTIKAEVFYKHARWNPSAQIGFESDKKGRRATLQLVADKATADGSAEGKELQVFVAAASRETLVRFKVKTELAFSIERQGPNLVFQMGGFQKAVPFDPADVRQLTLGCSTGNFSFKDIQILN